MSKNPAAKSVVDALNLALKVDGVFWKHPPWLSNQMQTDVWLSCVWGGCIRNLIFPRDMYSNTQFPFPSARMENICCRCGACAGVLFLYTQHGKLQRCLRAWTGGMSDPDRGGVKKTVCAKCSFSSICWGGFHGMKIPKMGIIRILGLPVQFLGTFITSNWWDFVAQS